MPEQTRESFRHGYFFPGDIGRMDEQGRLYLLGRKWLFINRDGFKVNPYEVEMTLETHPSVQEAAVIGMDNEYGGALRSRRHIEFCHDKLADYKIPSIIEFAVSFPRVPAARCSESSCQAGLPRVSAGCRRAL